MIGLCKEMARSHIMIAAGVEKRMDMNGDFN